MILSKKQLLKISEENRMELLSLLYSIEDELNYECGNVSKTIDYIQNTYLKKPKNNYKDKVEKAIDFLKNHDYLIEEEEYLLSILEGKDGDFLMPLEVNNE